MSGNGDLEARNATFIALYEEGMGPRAIGVRFGVHRDTVRSVLRLRHKYRQAPKRAVEHEMWEADANYRRMAIWRQQRAGVRALLAARELRSE